MGASILQSDHDRDTSAMVKSTLKRAVSLGKKVLGAKFAVDFANSALEPLELVPDRAIVCLDDLERIDEGMGLQSLVGAINYLVLIKRCRVLVLANPSGFDTERRLAWSALREKVFLFEFVLSPTQSTIDVVVAKAAPALSAEERQILAQVNGERSQNTNLRRLERVGRILQAVRTRIQRKLDDSIISCAFMLVSEKDAGELKDHDYYEMYATRFHVIEGREENKGKALEAMSFASKYFSSFSHYRFHPPLLTFVRDGHVDDQLEAWFSTPTPPEPERLLFDLQSVTPWYSLTETQVQAWVKRAQEVLNDRLNRCLLYTSPSPRD